MALCSGGEIHCVTEGSVQDGTPIGLDQLDQIVEMRKRNDAGRKFSASSCRGASYVTGLHVYLHVHVFAVVAVKLANVA